MDNRYVQQFKKGALEMILLCLIGREETYGYEIISQLNQSASILGYAKEGTVYPLLYRLQEAKKYYSLTPKGRAVLEELMGFWAGYEACVNGFIQAYQQSEGRE